jgi:hypothetical protein
MTEAAFDLCLVNVWSAHAPCPTSPIGMLLLHNLSPVLASLSIFDPLFQKKYDISFRQAIDWSWLFSLS